MIRLLAIALVLSVLCRWAFGRWPWDYLRPAPSRAQALFKARRLLGVTEKASAAQIREAHRKLAGVMHPDRGGSDAKLAEINAARDLLLDENPLLSETKE